LEGNRQSNRKPRVLAVASGGGHWAQLRRLRPALEGCDVLYASTHRDFGRDVAPERYVSIPDANRWQKARLIWMFVRIAWVVATFRPHVVLSTGAAPGYAAIRFGRMLGARTVWIDSVANAEQLSLSGTMARDQADEWLTQWEHLASPESARWVRGSGERAPRFEGAVL
jgi:hypothetical protein